MKAEIDATGVLKITPENGLESFALRKWADGYTQSAESESVLLVAAENDRDPDHTEKAGELIFGKGYSRADVKKIMQEILDRTEL